MPSKSRVLSVSVLLLAGCSSGGGKDSATPSARSASAAPQTSRVYAAASIVATAGAHCQLHPEGNLDPRETIPVTVDGDGVARFHAVPASSGDAVQSLSLDCTSESGETKSYPVDLRAEATFVARPRDPSKEPGTDRPALAGDPNRYSQAELLQLGYGLRPDAHASPRAYARWLAAAARPTRRLTAAQTPRASRRGRTPEEDAGTEMTPNWTGAALTGAPAYLETEATFVVPTPIPNDFGTGSAEASVWTGMGGFGTSAGLIQGGVWMESTSSAFSLFSFAEYCCGDNPSNLNSLPPFDPNPGDTVYVQEWYCDAQGNLNADLNNGGGYGCSVLEDQTSGEMISCTRYEDAVCSSCPPLYEPEWITGNSAEFVMERGSDPDWPGFSGGLSMSGEAYSSNGTWESLSTDPAVTKLADFTPVTNPDHVFVTLQSPDTVSWNVTAANGRVIADYDGDGKSDLAVWRPSNGNFYFVDSSNGSPQQMTWGVNGDIPVTGDYDGDGQTDFAYWTPGTGNWSIVHSSDASQHTSQWGANGDIPAPGDYDGDGRADLAVFRPSNGVFYVTYSSNGATPQTQWGANGDEPVPGDYDGDGKTDLAVWRPTTGTFYVIDSSNGAKLETQWGTSGDVPVPGDYDGDRKTDYVIWRPSNGTWYLNYSSTGGHPTTQFGTNGDAPLVGDYDGDGKTDLAVWRSSDGTFYVLSSSGAPQRDVAWGEAGDKAIPAFPLN